MGHLCAAMLRSLLTQLTIRGGMPDSGYRPSWCAVCLDNGLGLQAPGMSTAYSATIDRVQVQLRGLVAWTSTMACMHKI